MEIQNVAREPGYRSKIAVVSHASGVDPVGACVGPRGSRVRMVVSELRGEKIDIIPFNEEPARFVAKALSPARVREVLVDDEAKQATVIVPGRPALAGDRQGRPERPARRPAHRLARGHPLRDGVRRGRGGDGLRGGGGVGPLRRDPRQRQALPERLAARLALLRPARPPGARPTRRAPTTSCRRTRAPRSPRRRSRRRGAAAEDERAAEEPRRSRPRSRCRERRGPRPRRRPSRRRPRRRSSRRAASPLRRLRALAAPGRAAAARARRRRTSARGPASGRRTGAAPTSARDQRCAASLGSGGPLPARSGRP